MEKKIYMTDNDAKRLKELVKVARDFDREDEKYLRDLEVELQKACVIKSKDIPRDVITMNSKVLLRDLDSQEQMVYSLVFPNEADPDQDKISVLTPIGTALLGYKQGDIVEWVVPAGMAKLKVEKIVYQPEAAGDYHL